MVTRLLCLHAFGLTKNDPSRPPGGRRKKEKRHRASETTGGIHGFSLLELVVVVLLMSLAMTLFLGYNFRQESSVRLQAQAQAIAQLIRAMQSTSIVRGEDILLVYDPKKHELRSSLTNRAVSLGDDLSLYIQGEQVTKQRNVAVFYPDGTGVCDQLTVGSTNLEHRISLQVDPLFGDVRLVENDAS